MAEGGLIFRVWDKQRQCWAGFSHGRDNMRDLKEYALHEFKDDGLVYCDMEGWALQDDGGLLLVDECGNFAYADTERYEVRFDPELLANYGHPAAERWRARAFSAERDPDGAIRLHAMELARMVLESKQNVGRDMRWCAESLLGKIAASELPPAEAAVDPVAAK